MNTTDWKSKLSALTTENSNFEFAAEPENKITDEVAPKTIKKKAVIHVELDRKRGNQKQATILSNFDLEDDIKTLAKQLKVTCGIGGSVRGNEILLQGDCREKVIAFLEKENYRIKKIN